SARTPTSRICPLSQSPRTPWMAIATTTWVSASMGTSSSRSLTSNCFSTRSTVSFPAGKVVAPASSPSPFLTLAAAARQIIGAPWAAVVADGVHSAHLPEALSAGLPELASQLAGLGEEVVVLADLAIDPTWAAHPLVTGAPALRSLVFVAGRAISLVVASPAPRNPTAE